MNHPLLHADRQVVFNFTDAAPDDIIAPTVVDIDYLLYKGPVEKIFCESNFLLGSLNGIIYKKSNPSKLYSAFSKGALVIGNLGNSFYFGVSNPEHPKKGDVGSMLDGKLLHNPLDGNRPYSEIRQYVLRNFQSQEMVVFQYGQKCRFEAIQEQLVLLIQEFGSIEVAVGAEYAVFYFNIASQSIPFFQASIR
jgi:hypothetical protein